MSSGKKSKGAWKATTALAKSKEAKKPAIDWSKPVRTKRGEPVRILTTDAKSKFPIVGLVMHEDGEEAMESWTAEGRNLLHSVRSDMDLENYLEVTKYQRVPFRSSNWQPLHGDKLAAVFVNLDVTMTSDGVVTHVELSK